MTIKALAKAQETRVVPFIKIAQIAQYIRKYENNIYNIRFNLLTHKNIIYIYHNI